MRKDIIKKIIPNWLWKSIRSQKIYRDHRKAANDLGPVIEHQFASNSSSINPIRPTREDLAGKKIIWQYWAQGFDNVPEVVRICLQSVELYAGEYSIIRIDDNSIKDYLAIPGWIAEKRGGTFGYTPYSDMVRLALLVYYGGIWLDSTILLTGKLPEELTSGNLFFYQRNPKEPNKSYWENSYAYYFGWSPKFKVNMLNSVIASNPHNPLLESLFGILTEIWHTKEKYPYYFSFQIITDILVKKYRFKNCSKLVSDCIPHLLMQYINDPEFSLMSLDKILETTAIHKLSYKDIDKAKLKKTIDFISTYSQD